MALTLKKMSTVVVVAGIALLSVGIVFLGNQRPAHAESLAQQIVCKVFSQLNEVSNGIKVPFPIFRAGCNARGGIEVIKIVVGGTAQPSDFSIHVKTSSGTDLDGSPQPGAEVGRVYGNVLAGSYTISESGGPSGYTAAYSGHCGSTGAIAVSVGVLSSCTITNTFAGTPPPAAACANGVDDDEDGFVDSNDPNCHTDGNPTNTASYNPSATTETGTLPVCWNGLDDDGDSLVDMLDPGCSSPTDSSEADGGGGSTAQCSDTVDNDADGKIDSADPNCHTDGNPANTASYDPQRGESDALPACVDGLDNDGDGKVDSADPGCSGATDDNETDPTTLPQCSDSIDNDTDGKVDIADPNCHTDGDPANTASYVASRGESDSIPACIDGIDNDADGMIDIADPNCHTDGNPANQSSYDPSRTETSALPACVDGVDNDSDGKIDLIDPGCTSATDTDETDVPTGSTGSSSSGSSSGGSDGTQIFGSSASAPGGLVGQILGVATTSTPTASCDAYLTEFIRYGGANNPEQVKRLQVVLRVFEGADIGVSGVYDSATLAAVHAFQEKYAVDILAPWGISKSTGYVYLTTRKKINEIYCDRDQQFLLTPAEQKVVEDARAEMSSQPTTAAKTTSVKPLPSKSPSLTPSPAPLPTQMTPERADMPDATTPEQDGQETISIWQRIVQLFRGSED